MTLNLKRQVNLKTIQSEIVQFQDESKKKVSFSQPNEKSFIDSNEKSLAFKSEMKQETTQISTTFDTVINDNPTKLEDGSTKPIHLKEVTETQVIESKPVIDQPQRNFRTYTT